jgi:hypothetical protein
MLALVGLFFDPEDRDYMFIQNYKWLSAEYMELYTPQKMELFNESCIFDNCKMDDSTMHQLY